MATKPIFHAEYIEPIEINVLRANLQGNVDGVNIRQKMESYNLTSKLSQEIHLPEGQVIHTLKLKMDFFNKKGKSLNVKCSFEIQLKYHVVDLGNHSYLNDDDELELTDVMRFSIAGISFSTARGIIYTRSLGTPLEGIILPVIRPQTLFESTDSED
ncbi:hypothetical protein GC194_04940 [bacterium]|nr:hypothetical protein [bacterium]